MQIALTREPCASVAGVRVAFRRQLTQHHASPADTTVYALTPDPGTVALACSVAVVLCDGVGQCCATFGTITSNHFAFFVEGTLWSTIFTICLSRGTWLLWTNSGGGYSDSSRTFLLSLIFGMAMGLPCALVWMHLSKKK